MGTASNTGHANNLANFKKVTKAVVEFGASYNPAQEMLKMVYIEKAAVLGQKTLDDQQAAEVACSDAINKRVILFEELDRYLPRVVSIYIISGIDAKSIENVKAIQRKMHSKSKPKKGSKSAAASSDDATPSTEQPKPRTASQLGFEDKTSNFAQIASYVEANPKYAANEPELTKEGVRKFADSLVAANDRCATTDEALNTARAERDKVLYTNADSLYNIFRGMKLYVKGVYGNSSAEYKRISGIEYKPLIK
jgi:hypothetical protein